MPSKNQRYRRQFLQSLAALSFVGGSAAYSSPPDDRSQSDHVAWVAASLERMLTVKLGMTRDQLMQVFSMEGGLSTALQRTFVSRDCQYFKVDVSFRRASGFKGVGSQDQISLERDDDLIASISRPYLQFSIMD